MAAMALPTWAEAPPDAGGTIQVAAADGGLISLSGIQAPL